MARVLVEYSGDLFNDPEKLIKRVFGDTMLKTVTYGETEVAKRAPVGVSGNLRAGIFGKVLQYNRGKIAVQGPAVRYAEVVEYGRKPGKFPPQAPIMLWVKRVIRPREGELESVTFLIQRKIARKGTKGKFMFKKAEKSIRRFAGQAFQQAKETIERLLSD